MDVRVLVGLNCQRLRRERGLSQEELAFRSKTTRGYLSSIETGRRNATILQLEKLAKALDVEVGAFFVNAFKDAGGEPTNSAPTDPAQT